ncbi:chromate efflux transporter [Xinfangfangia sp. CPCC 101601]|uniref:Chromate efflux transporter n=1 Tax=Pseudogemmobacter lacusdianii TaxID=3069608 RepID=A0ABU0VWB1_9RHOB|nr:chromate efflux transporter [Xinfangfangia sp. CPCC 101601]MDQ2066035.1 chromate efflux transporter [Xinfangfangia sp. CPCC 101601]
MTHDPQIASQGGSAAEVFGAFLKLGLTAFGGPIAHLGYFREAFVARRGWLSDAAYADLVALCQFLPGPASSQVGVALGVMRAGWLGGLAAFVGFTLPSALILLVLGLTAANLTGPVGSGILDGLKIAAVAIVAQAVLGMARSLCPDRERAAIAAGAVVLLAFLPPALAMIGAIILGGILGLGLGRGTGSILGQPLTIAVTKLHAGLALATFVLLFLGLPLLASQSQTGALLDGFYRAGTLVFGGGHVVLPLLQAEVVAPGWVTPDQFLMGYAAAQAVPGPLFTFAAYLGAVLGPEPNGVLGAALALTALFLPGFLLLIAVLPYWESLRANRKTQAAMQGANAAVVGILGAALYDPVFTSAIGGMPDFALALALFVALTAWKAPPWLVVLFAGLGGVLLAQL